MKLIAQITAERLSDLIRKVVTMADQPDFEKAMRELQAIQDALPTELAALASGWHELYLQLQEAGFLSREAMYLTAVAISGRPGEIPPPS